MVVCLFKCVSLHTPSAARNGEPKKNGPFHVRTKVSWAHPTSEETEPPTNLSGQYWKPNRHSGGNDTHFPRFLGSGRGGCYEINSPLKDSSQSSPSRLPFSPNTFYSSSSSRKPPERDPNIQHQKSNG